MPLIDIEQTKLSDLVVHEIDPSVGYARRVVNISTTATDVPMGTIVYRTISSGALDQGASFAVLSDPEVQLVATNEFAVQFGDNYGCKTAWIAGASASTVNSVAFVKGDVILKDELILDATGFTRNSVEHRKLKQLLENQGVIIEQTL